MEPARRRQIIHEMLTRSDPETLRRLDDDLMLFVFAIPDGLELVADWYTRQQPGVRRRRRCRFGQ